MTDDDRSPVDAEPLTIIRAKLPDADPVLLLRLADGWYQLPEYRQIWRTDDEPLHLESFELLAGRIARA